MTIDPPINRQDLFSGTRPVASHLKFDIEALQEYLLDTLPDFRGPIKVTQFKGGQSNPTYKVSTPSAEYVLRRKPPGKLLPSAHAIEREFRVIGALHRLRYPVPEPCLLCEDPAIIGTSFHLTRYVDGRIFWQPHAPGLSEEDRRRLFRSLNATIARLHGIDFRAAGLGEFGKPQGYVQRQIARWSKQYESSKTDSIEEMDALMSWLPTAVPQQGEAALIHGDFRLDNCVVEHGLATIAAVLDWELATIGDPLADFTYHLMQWHMPVLSGGGGVGSLLDPLSKVPGVPRIEAYVEEYCGHRGLDGIPDLDIYLAYKFFRLAAIFQGIAGRVRDGSAVNENAALMARQVRPVAETAWKFARKAGT